ncbi:MAG: hypothetical protein IJ187_06785 [Neisseriaceae bacterium]|nr:hypothetical protein [Neisseriaceae bacterium]
MSRRQYKQYGKANQRISVLKFNDYNIIACVFLPTITTENLSGYLKSNRNAVGWAFLPTNAPKPHFGFAQISV